MMTSIEASEIHRTRSPSRPARWKYSGHRAWLSYTAMSTLRADSALVLQLCCCCLCVLSNARRPQGPKHRSLSIIGFCIHLTRLWHVLGAQRPRQRVVCLLADSKRDRFYCLAPELCLENIKISVEAPRPAESRYPIHPVPHVVLFCVFNKYVIFENICFSKDTHE